MRAMLAEGDVMAGTFAKQGVLFSLIQSVSNSPHAYVHFKNQ